jgi:hypothetical protein
MPMIILHFSPRRRWHVPDMPDMSGNARNHGGCTSVSYQAAKLGRDIGRLRMSTLEVKIMWTKTAMALAAAAIFGVVSVAQANENADNWNEVGGYRIGPLGQRLGGTGFHWRGHRGAFFGFAYAPGHRRVWHYY